MSEDTMAYGRTPGLVLGRAAQEPKTKVELARALGRAERRIEEIEERFVLSTMDRDRAQATIREVEAILDGSDRFRHMGPPLTRAISLANEAVAVAADAKRASEAFAKRLAVITEAIDRGATLAKVGPDAGYVCERGLLRCSGATPVAAAEAFVKADAAAPKTEETPHAG